MGFFDVSITQKCDSKKAVSHLEQSLKDELKEQGYKPTIEEKQELIKNYKAKNALLKYNLTFHQHNDELIVQGELQQVLILTVLILFSILFTYGIGVILIVGYAFYQRLFTAKALNAVMAKAQGT